jgi:hypothetical protein
MTKLQKMVYMDAQKRLETEYDIFVTGEIVQDDIPSDTKIKEGGYEGSVEQVLTMMLNTDDVKYLRKA